MHPSLRIIYGGVPTPIVLSTCRACATKGERVTTSEVVAAFRRHNSRPEVLAENNTWTLSESVSSQIKTIRTQQR